MKKLLMRSFLGRIFSTLLRSILQFNHSEFLIASCAEKVIFFLFHFFFPLRVGWGGEEREKGGGLLVL